MRLDSRLHITLDDSRRRRRRIFPRIVVLALLAGAGLALLESGVHIPFLDRSGTGSPRAGEPKILALPRPGAGDAGSELSNTPAPQGNVLPFGTLDNPAPAAAPAPSEPAPLQDVPESGEGAPDPSEDTVEEPEETEIAVATVTRWIEAEVQRGDTLSLIFSRLGLRTDDLYALIDGSDHARNLEQLRPGQLFRIRADHGGRILELEHQASAVHGTRVQRNGSGFRVEPFTHPVEMRVTTRSGRIEGSFYQSALSSGMSDGLIMEFAGLFAWDIDFALALQPGDRFVAIHEEGYLDGARVSDGSILAAEFVNRGKTYRAVRYEAPDGQVRYLTPDGQALRRSFLRSPVDFRRISSHFQPERWHPVLGVKRPHRGVDYAAPTGTPIKAAGDGVVQFIGNQGGYGRTIILQHGSRYTTLYAHMSGFARGLRRSSRVSQGDIIGFVGQSGLATGPHLHYEFRIDGTHVDPVTVKLPGMPLEDHLMEDFRRKTAHLVAQLDAAGRIRLAQYD